MKTKEKGIVLIYGLLIAAVVAFVAAYEVGVKHVFTPQTKGVPVVQETTPAAEHKIEEIETIEQATTPAPTTTPSKRAKESAVQPKKTSKDPILTEKTSTSSVLSNETTTPLPTPNVSSKYIPHEKGDLEATNILLSTNKERQKEGLNALSANEGLDRAAIKKMNHMFDNQYFEHVAPRGGEDVVYWVGTVNYEYITVGENLAMGDFKTEEEMVTAWMGSPGHRANILKSSYEEIGIAVGKGIFEGNQVWIGVQVFGTPLSSCPSISKDLLLTIDAAKQLILETESTLRSMETEISSLHPKTEAEYLEYLKLIEEHNTLVVKYQSMSATLEVSIQTYNTQVQAYNACIATK